jgi:hypothetical protein
VTSIGQDELRAKPQIDSISEVLVHKTGRTHREGKKIWEHLYEMDKTLKEKRDQMHLEKKLHEEDESLQSCTFRPDIGNGARQAGDVQVRQSGDIYERSKQWKQHLEER